MVLYHVESWGPRGWVGHGRFLRRAIALEESRRIARSKARRVRVVEVETREVNRRVVYEYTPEDSDLRRE